MKQKPMIVLLCVLALCGALAFVLTPYSVAPQAEQLEVWRVQRMIGNAEFEDLTSQINLTQLSELLTSCKASRLPFYQQSYSLDTVQYEIYAHYKGKPLHFVLGKNSFVYESAPWNHHLRDAQALIDALDTMLPTSTAV